MILDMIPSINTKHGVDKWDIILVDGPTGFNSQQPGRQQSIATAWKYAAEDGSVFVHDVHRDLEQKSVRMHHRCVGCSMTLWILNLGCR